MSIAWCDETANPFYVVNERGKRGWHCEKVSPGCAHCYAERQNEMQRFDVGTGLAFQERHRKRLSFYLDERILQSWTSARVGRIVFVNSMTDTFGDWWPDEYRDRLFEAMRWSVHEFIVLTKRPDALYAYATQEPYLYSYDNDRVNSRIPPNVWLGVSVESPAYLGRVERLLHTPVAHRLVSYEPALEYTDFSPYLGPGKIEWLLFGCETGPEARPVKSRGTTPTCPGVAAVDAARCVITDCDMCNAAPFIKQLGTQWAREHRARSKHGSNPLEWPRDVRVQEWPESMKR